MPLPTIEQYQQTAQFIQIDGFNYAYWQSEQTEKPALLFIHGFPSASWDWHFQWQALKDDYHLVAMDMLGFGLSDKPSPYRYSIAQQAIAYTQITSRYCFRATTALSVQGACEKECRLPFKHMQHSNGSAV